MERLMMNKSDNYVHMSIKVPPDLKPWIQVHAKKINRSASGLIAWVMMQYREQVEAGKDDIVIKKN